MFRQLKLKFPKLIKRGYRRLERHVKRAHYFVHARSRAYRWWHARPYAKHVHISLAGALSIFIFISVFSWIGSVFASTAWTQTDWSGGVGTSTATQYSSVSSVTGVTAGQANLQQTSGWPGSYASWAKRSPITLTNSGGAQTNYAVNLNITYDSDMQADFDDLRFTNSAGTALDYWLQTKTDSSSAIVWVEVDSLAATGTTTPIYMYYGNSGASAASNGDNTFQFFDDFNGASLDASKWSRTDPRSHISQSGGKLLLNNGSGNGNWDTDIHTQANFNRADIALEFDMRWTSDYNPYDALMWGWKNSTSGISYTELYNGHYNQGDGNCTTNCASPFYESGNATGNYGSWSNNTDYVIRERLRASGGNYYEKSIDGGANFTTDYASTFSTGTPVKPAFMLYAGDYTVDNLRIRKWMTTEPSAATGAEQPQYSSSGTLTSAVFDGGLPNDWGQLTYNGTTPAGTSLSVKVRTGNNADLSDATAFSSCSPISSGSDVTSACVVDKSRYAQYQVTFAGNGVSTPVLQDISLDYSASDTETPPTNASSVLMYRSNGGASVTSNAWNNTNPYFTWSAGADDGGGSGIKGYCLYLGHDNTADPATTKGLLGSSPVNTGGACQFAISSTGIDLSTSGYIGSALATSNSPYYLLVKAIDNANNIYNGSAASFQFRYDGTPPTNPSFITAPSQFVSNKAVTLTWPNSGGDSPSDVNSGVAGLQYRIGSGGTWYGVNHNGNQNAGDLLDNDGSYTMQSTPDFDDLNEGNNLVYFRTWDSAGNYSPAYVTTVVKLNTTSPSSPQNVDASPNTNTTNSFAFSWLAPSSFTGSASNLTYCYSINAVPNAGNCTYTAAGVTSLSAGAYATQPGENTFYVVAKDEAGNINYATQANTTFTANTAAPGVALNPDIADISVKTTSNWKLALSWETPSQTGAGVASYKVMRSTNNSSFTQVASTSGTSYVDSGLTQHTYYYKVKACDSANNCGALTSVISKLPTGKFTTAAGLLKKPEISNLNTRKTTISWVTDRSSDSKIAFGIKSGSYSSDEIANSDQTANHSINIVNLNPGTTYYFVSKWTDEDGNTGVSPESSFTTLPAPKISDVKTVSVNLSNATVNFTSKSADLVKIYYGKSKDFGAVQTLNTSSAESTYSAQLSGLDDGSTYYYRINPFDADGNEYDQTTFSFTTPARPRITNLRFQPVKDEPTSTQKVTWDTNVASTSEISYGPEGSAPQNAVDSNQVTDHSIVIKGLKDNSVYGLIAQSRDNAGNLATSDRQVFRTALDTRPPKISSVKVSASIKGTGSDAHGQVIVSWKTDEPATSQVAYGEGSSGGSYANSTAEDASLVTDHLVIVSNLPTSQIFHLQSISRDGSKNKADSDNYSAIIGDSSDNVLSIVFNALQKVFGL